MKEDDARPKTFLWLSEILEDPTYAALQRQAMLKHERRMWRKKHHWKRYSPSNKPYPPELMDE